MIIKSKIGTLTEILVGNRQLDPLPIEWHETGKRILHKKTLGGREVVLKFMNASHTLLQDDVLFEDDQSIIVVNIQPCEVISIKPASMYEMAKLCYEIGNKHLPLFYEDEVMLIPFDAPLLRWLTAAGFSPVRENKKLLHQLKTTVSSHAHADPGSSLFSKILKLTTPAND